MNILIFKLGLMRKVIFNYKVFVMISEQAYD